MNLWNDDNSSMMEAFMVSTDLSGYPSWAAPSPAPPTPTPAAAVLSPAPASYFNQETLQQHLQTLIESAKEAWTYAIFWQSSIDVATGDSLLGWGDGYYKGGSEEDKRKGKSSSASSAADQEHRKRVLRELNSLISGGPAGRGGGGGGHRHRVVLSRVHDAVFRQRGWAPRPGAVLGAAAVARGGRDAGGRPVRAGAAGAAVMD